MLLVVLTGNENNFSVFLVEEMLAPKTTLIKVCFLFFVLEFMIVYYLL